MSWKYSALLQVICCVVFLKIVNGRIPDSGDLSTLCPRNCNCSTQHLIICSKVQFKVITELCEGISKIQDTSEIDILLRVRLPFELTLSETEGNIIPFCSTPISHLDLSDNDIETLKSQLFENLNVSSTIDLSRNAIDSIENQPFSLFNSILMLNLSFNRLESIDKDNLFGLDSLQVLDISNNNLNFIGPEAFQLLPNLKQLGLNNNKLTVFPVSSLDSSLLIESIELQYNHLQNIAYSMNVSFPFLKTIDLAFNDLDCSCVLTHFIDSISNFSKILVDPLNTVCSTPSNLQGKSIVNNKLVCIPPSNMITFPSNKDVLIKSTISLECKAKGYPIPSIVWFTPWGHAFSRKQSSFIPDSLDVSHSREYSEINTFFVTKIEVDENNALLVTQFRGSLSGSFICLAINPAGNKTKELKLSAYSKIKPIYLQSFLVGGYASSVFLLFGFLVGFVRYVSVYLLHRFNFNVPLFSNVPSEKSNSITKEPSQYSDKVDNESFHDENDRDDSENPSQASLIHSLSSDEEEEKHNTTGEPNNPAWPAHILETLDEAKGRLKQGVGRRMERVRKNVQHIKESGSVYVHSIVESGSSAASRMKAGMASGVETVKYTVQSFKELCGTGDMGNQTISMISVETDMDTHKQKEVTRQVTFV